MQDFFQFNFNTLVALGGVVFAIAYAWEKFRSGGKKAEEELIKNREELIAKLSERLEAEARISDSLKNQLQDLTRQFHAMTLELGELKGQVKAYRDILENRNPELEKTLANLNTLSTLMPTFMADVTKALKIKSRRYAESLAREHMTGMKPQEDQP